MLLLVSDKATFIAAMGGPDGPVGTNGLTVSQLADRLEVVIGSLTMPGYRVYNRIGNETRFWDILIDE